MILYLNRRSYSNEANDHKWLFDLHKWPRVISRFGEWFCLREHVTCESEYLIVRYNLYTEIAGK